LTRDRHYGQHQIFLNIRLDDFNPPRMIEIMKEIQPLMEEFENLRAEERTILEAITLERAQQVSNAPVGHESPDFS